MTQLWQIRFEVPAEAVESFAALFDEEALALSVQNPPRRAMAVIEAIYDAPPELAACQALLDRLATQRGCAKPVCTLTSLAAENWLHKVAVSLPPRRIGNLTIYGAHAAAQVPSFHPRLQIEAATAFGTGEHPSTQMCLHLLQTVLRAERPRRVLDIGCGSGILALAAARLAHRRVWAVDCDGESVRLTRHNAQVNGLAANIRAYQGQGYAVRMVRRYRPYDLVFANIFARPLMALAADLRAHLAPGGYAILAGLLTSQAPAVLAAHKMQRLHLVQQLRQDEWSALLLRKRAR